MPSLSAGMPVTAVYLEHPLSIAALAASRTGCGGSKSGSPTPNANTSTPRALRSSARAFIARVMLGATALNREANCRDTVLSRLESRLLGCGGFSIGRVAGLLGGRSVAAGGGLLLGVGFVPPFGPLLE